MLSYVKKLLGPKSPSASEPDAPMHETYSAISDENAFASESATLILRDIFSTPENARTIIEIRSDGILLERQGQETQKIALDNAKDYAAIDEEIRSHIARKIAVLAPVLAKEEKHFLLMYTIRVLKTLAEDQVTRVRQIIAEELRDNPYAPTNVIRTLAWDSDTEVAAPVLEYSPLLSDYELLDIIASANLPGVTEAIAKRKELSETVTGAIIDSENDAAIYHLLRNPRAKISESGLNQVIDMAEAREDWHEPLIYRPELTLKTVNRVASFISLALFRKIEESKTLSPEMLVQVKQSVTQRLQNMKLDRLRSAESEAADMHYRGLLTNEELQARIENGEAEFVQYALALRSRYAYDIVKRTMEMQNPRIVTALCWRAGLSMREAIQVQLRIAGIHHKDVLYARDGVDYPLSDAQLDEILALIS